MGNLVGDQLGAAAHVRPGSRTCCCWPSRPAPRRTRRCCRRRRRRSCPRRCPGRRSGGSAARCPTMPADSAGSTLPKGITAKTAMRGDEHRQRSRGNTEPGRRGRGVNSSLKTNFTPSASGWPRPNRRILVKRDAHPVRPQPVLHPGRHPPLQQHQVGRRGHQAADQQGDLHQGFEDQCISSQAALTFQTSQPPAGSTSGRSRLRHGAAAAEK